MKTNFIYYPYQTIIQKHNIQDHLLFPTSKSLTANQQKTNKNNKFSNILRQQILNLNKTQMTRKSVLSHKIIIAICIVLSAVNPQVYQSKQLTIATSPLVTESGSTENKSVCFADCKSCQSRTGDCEVCFVPWFQLRQGKCVLAYPEYKLESTEEEQRFVNFIASSEWSYNGLPVASKLCTPNPTTLNKNFTIIGPFSSGKVTYQRTISRHNYFGIKFMLILSNWTSPDTGIDIKVTNQADVVLFSQSVRLQSNQIRLADMDFICSGAPLDRKVSIDMKLIEQQSSQLKIQFTSTMTQGATWGLSSFVLITGSCNSKCAVCNGYTPRVDSCSKCNNFLANNLAGQKCSTCLNGFFMTPSLTRCQKCPIQFKECRFNQTSNVICQYSNITNVTTNCSFINSVYFDNKQLTQQTFFSSLYSIQNRGAFVTKCGAYSVVGPANFGDIISRTFLQLPAHIQISINFNIFIFQQKQQNQNYSIAILINGEQFPIQPAQQSIIITGTSNQCDLFPILISTDRKFQAMRTFQTQTFINNNKLENVVIGVSLGAFNPNSDTKWGLRDMRLVFKRCDDNCEVCSENGCVRCKGLYQLKDLTCTDCLIGTGINVTSKKCQACPANCLQCNINPLDKQSGPLPEFKCTRCISGFYLYTFNNKTTCELNPNYGPPSLDIKQQGFLCPVVIPTGNTTTKTLNFVTYQNRATKGFEFNGPSVKKNIQFNLIKVDNWDGDYLDIYANDLLVKRLQLGNSGSFICEIGNQGEEISFHQFVLDDNSPNLKLEFQAVLKNQSEIRRFGINGLKVYPVGCVDCKNYNFLYNVDYNYDQRLFAEMAFNLVYQNKDPQQFKNIFKMKAGQRYLNYEISSNDSIRYWLKSEPIAQGQIINQNLTIECLYPERVTTNIPSSENPEGNFKINRYQFFENRLLQASNGSTYQNIKSLDNSGASTFIQRFSPLRNREESVLGLQTFFNVLTRIVIYLGFASFFFGCQTPCTHVMHNFQKLWVHIYVASLALSPIFKTALWGFRQSQDQNIAINPDQWESGLPKYLYYQAPAQYQHYYKDITFFRHIYNVGVAFAILLFVYIVFHFVMKRFNKSNLTFLRHMRTVFTHRPLFYFNSIIFYQYFTVVLACCLQFLDLKTRTNQPAFAGVNAAACIIAFIFATLYPILFHLLIHRKRSNVLSLLQTIMGNNRNKDFSNHQRDLQLLEQQHVIYNNRYAEIFFRFLPKQLWNQSLGQSEMITQKQIFYNIFRFGDLWWHAIVVILLHYSPFAQAFLLILTNGFHLAVNAFASLNTNKYFRIFKCLQLLFFIVIEIMIIVMLSLLKTLRFQSYETLGIVAIIFIFFILVVTFIRFIYTFYRLYRQYVPKEQDQRMVIRRDKAYDQGWINK